jgi:hypothetical protein
VNKVAGSTEVEPTSASIAFIKTSLRDALIVGFLFWSKSLLTTIARS